MNRPQISLRLASEILARVKDLADKRGCNVQELVRQYVAHGLEQEGLEQEQAEMALLYAEDAGP